MRTVHSVNRLGRSPERVRDLVMIAMVLRQLGLRRVADRLTAPAVRTAAELGDPTLTARIEWEGEGPVRGTGQRLFLIGEDAVAAHDLGAVEFA